jgi:hypothetical protein
MYSELLIGMRVISTILPVKTKLARRSPPWSSGTMQNSAFALGTNVNREQQMKVTVSNDFIISPERQCL